MTTGLLMTAEDLKIKKLFIANRGEICRRIATTSQRLGVQTVTLLEDAEPKLFLLNCIDEFARVQPNSDSNNYLNANLLVELAKEYGCDAIHPGFGFLSESQEFAELVLANKLIWVGPNPESMASMASKDTSRDLAKKAGVPVNEAMQGIDLDNPKYDYKQVKAFATKTGYPLLVKAAYGGGGKGMRLVHQESELKDSLERCFSEAKSSFANGLLLVEKYINSPRHVEVQILADSHGQAFAIGDRDCSIQRRHQKIIEEAPAPNIDPDVRAQLHDSAVMLAKAVNYDSTGTVEYLLEEHGDKQSFYFLEMNTRLQVEHPVSEEVFGLDLVEWQLKIASGAKLPDYSNIPAQGHSIEARIYAEDPEANYLPSPGPVHAFVPNHGLGIRWEIGIDTIDEVSTRFDPMVAKCVSFGPDREAAIDRLTNALDETIFCGPRNNIRFLVEVMRHNKFKEVALSTHFLEHHKEEIFSALTSSYDAGQDEAQNLTKQLKAYGSGSKNTGTSAADFIKRAYGKSSVRKNNNNAPTPLSIVNQQNLQSVSFPNTSSTVFYLNDKKTKNSKLLRGIKSTVDHVSYIWANCNGHWYSTKIEKGSLSSYLNSTESSNEIAAPVPGKIINLKCKSGTKIEKNDIVLVLESMKMEFEVKASKDGSIKTFNVGPGDQVAAGDILAVWE